MQTKACPDSLGHQQLHKYIDASVLSQEAPVFRCNRKHLRDYLRQGIPVEFNSRLEGIEKGHANQLTAKFSNGKAAQGSLVVGADGINSAGQPWLEVLSGRLWRAHIHGSGRL